MKDCLAKYPLKFFCMINAASFRNLKQLKTFINALSGEALGPYCLEVLGRCFDPILKASPVREFVMKASNQDSNILAIHKQPVLCTYYIHNKEQS